MHSYDIVGYTHSDGYCLCPEHAGFGEMDDSGNESGKVYPIFAGEEWDYPGPSCDVCKEEIDVVLLNVPEPPETWSLLVGNVGWVHTDNPNYEVVKRDYDEYVTISKTEPNSMAGNEQVTLWSSRESDPIEEYDPPLCQQCHNLLQGSCIVDLDGDTVHESCWRDYAFSPDMSPEEVQEVFESVERITL